MAADELRHVSSRPDWRVVNNIGEINVDMCSARVSLAYCNRLLGPWVNLQVSEAKPVQWCHDMTFYGYDGFESEINAKCHVFNGNI